MYCPNCYAEYREGFTRCNDCQVDLVEERRAASQQESPDEETSQVRFLAWFAPMALACALALIPFVHPELLRIPLLKILVLLVLLVSPLGSFWMLYQAIRYERQPWMYFLASFVPFLFVWYRLGRYRRRNRPGQPPVATG